jgi:hypothetical protein
MRERQRALLLMPMKHGSSFVTTSCKLRKRPVELMVGSKQTDCVILISYCRTCRSRAVTDCVDHGSPDCQARYGGVLLTRPSCLTEMKAVTEWLSAGNCMAPHALLTSYCLKCHVGMCAHSQLLFV